MFERFTERARQVVVLAQEESILFKHDYRREAIEARDAKLSAGNDQPEDAS